MHHAEKQGKEVKVLSGSLIVSMLYICLYLDIREATKPGPKQAIGLKKIHAIVRAALKCHPCNIFVVQ